MKHFKFFAILCTLVTLGVIWAIGMTYLQEYLQPIMFTTDTQQEYGARHNWFVFWCFVMGMLYVIRILIWVYGYWEEKPKPTELDNIRYILKNHQEQIDCLKTMRR